MNGAAPGLVPDCNLWCELVFDGQGDIDTQFRKARNAFSDCLTTGTNASKSLGGMVCSKGISNVSGDEDSGGNDSTNDGASDTSADMAGAGSSTNTNVKLVGLTGALLIAGMEVGGL
jgi:hypothetical protein